MSAARRYATMSRIRSKGTKPEKAVGRALQSLRFKFTRYAADVPGRPDYVIRSRRIAVLVHGCFWHQHRGCKLARTPTSRPDYWPAKLRGNVTRDRLVSRKLKRAGFRVVTVWECQTAQADRLTLRLSRALRANR